MTTFNVLNLGAGWQSTRIFLGSLRGELPRFDAAIFADTMFEPKAVYRHLEWLRQLALDAGVPLLIRTAGDLKQDSIDFRQYRKSGDGKRYASIPFFIKNTDGSVGRVKRQCTKEYKIEVVEKTIRREILGLKARQRIPKGVIVRQWFGISSDEPSRAVFPGQWRQKKMSEYRDLLSGEVMPVYSKKYHPTPWLRNVYPLLGQVWNPDRTIDEVPMLAKTENRDDVGEWLKANYPERHIPRSACIACPFRSNEEWEKMRDEEPEEFAEACDFDDAMRSADADADADGQRTRGRLVGLPFVHRQLVPLRMADLHGHGERGGGCGTLLDGQDGLCGV